MMPVFDYHASLTRMGHDALLFREMIGLLLEDGPRRWNEIARGLDERDAQKIHHAAHSLKGLAANFSAGRAMEAAACLDALARNENWGEMTAAAEGMQEALEELLAALRPMVAVTSDSA